MKLLILKLSKLIVSKEVQTQDTIMLIPNLTKLFENTITPLNVKLELGKDYFTFANNDHFNCKNIRNIIFHCISPTFMTK